MTNVVIWKLDKLVHKQSGSHDLLFYFINNSIIIVQVRYFTIETKEVAVLDIAGFCYHIRTQVKAEVLRKLSFTCALVRFNSTVSYTYTNHMISQLIRYSRACNFYAHLWHIYSATDNQVITATMTSTLWLETLCSLVSLLAESLHQGNRDRNYNPWNIVYTPYAGAAGMLIHINGSQWEI